MFKQVSNYHYQEKELRDLRTPQLPLELCISKFGGLEIKRTCSRQPLEGALRSDRNGAGWWPEQHSHRRPEKHVPESEPKP